jgi:hypothetical protein
VISLILILLNRSFIRVSQELSHLRGRVRELDEERRRIAQINRTVAKHIGSGSGVGSGSSSTSTSTIRGHVDAAVPGVAGLSNGKVRSGHRLD